MKKAVNKIWSKGANEGWEGGMCQIKEEGKEVMKKRRRHGAETVIKEEEEKEVEKKIWNGRRQ